MGQGDVAIVGPERIVGDVRNDYRLCAIGCRAARSRCRTNGQAIDCVGIGLGKTGRGSVPKTIAIQE